MNQITFERIVREQLDRCNALLLEKGVEYAANAGPLTDIDRLASFKKAAALQEETPAQAMFGMLAKHLISIADMVKTDTEFPLERWDEKISDSINYLLLLRAIIEEGRTEAV